MLWPSFSLLIVMTNQLLQPSPEQRSSKRHPTLKEALHHAKSAGDATTASSTAAYLERIIFPCEVVGFLPGVKPCYRGNGATAHRKFEAIRAALRGKWVTTLITDLDVAQLLLDI